jgi:hypothetical protein
MRRAVQVFCLVSTVLLFACSKKEPLPEPQQVKVVTQPSSQAEAKESGDDFLKGNDLRIFQHVAEIPAACSNAFAGADFDTDSHLIDPPEDGNHAKWDKSLTPTSKRLIFAGANARTCFIYFRKGSSVPTYQLQIFHIGTPATITYHGVDSDHVYSDPESLRRAVTKNTFMRMTGPERF